MEKIGLLFVHGIGEQARFEHLRNSSREFAELIQGYEAARVAQSRTEDRDGDGDPDCEPEPPALALSVVDRTDHWKTPPGEVVFGPEAPAPIEINLASEQNHVRIDCHEVWWADLGARDSLSEKIGFWIWGLGQWSAPIYRELDPTGISDREPCDEPPDTAPPNTADLAKLPHSVAGDFWQECFVRLRLSAAGLVTVLTVFSWSLIKRLFEALAKAPSTTLIFQYVGDVRAYERRAEPNSSIASDPGQPLRVPIRRRMVSEMVAMGTRGYDRWFVCAHSLGTVLAYNGLTEIGHALPNYLSRDAWRAVPERLKRKEGTRRRDADQLHKMMPARPPWLESDDVIDRKALFANLRGFLTYGSPLDKFAALWPRIVASATDREDETDPAFDRENCHWVNLSSANDPVSGEIDAYDDPEIERYLPKLRNVMTGIDLLPGLSHIRYFRSEERHSKSNRVDQRQQIMRWLIDPKFESSGIASHGTQLTNWLAALEFLLVIVILAIMTGVLATAAGGLLGVLGVPWFDPIGSVASIWGRFFANFLLVLGCSLAVVMLIGLWRWAREAKLNKALAEADGKDINTQRLLSHQSIAAWLLLWCALIVLVPATAADFGACGIEPAGRLPICVKIADWHGESWWTLAGAAIFLVFALFVQSAINKRHFSRENKAKARERDQEAA